MSVSRKFIKIENLGNLRKLIISNPKRKNALSTEAYEELTSALNEAAADDTVRITALTGDGDYYSSGNDLSNFLKASNMPETIAKSRVILKAMITSFYTFPKLLVCVVNGPCIGIAATSAALCDVAYAVDSAYFHTPFSGLGLCAEGCASYTFPRILGKSKANEMLILNHKLTAAEALQFNFVSKVFKRSELDTILWPQLQEQSKLPLTSILATNRLVAKFDRNNLQQSCDYEIDELYKCFETEEFMTSLTNFMQRRSKL